MMPKLHFSDIFRDLFFSDLPLVWDHKNDNNSTFSSKNKYHYYLISSCPKLSKEQNYLKVWKIYTKIIKNKLVNK